MKHVLGAAGAAPSFFSSGFAAGVAPPNENALAAGAATNMMSESTDSCIDHLPAPAAGVVVDGVASLLPVKLKAPRAGCGVAVAAPVAVAGAPPTGVPGLLPKIPPPNRLVVVPAAGAAAAAAAAVVASEGFGGKPSSPPAAGPVADNRHRQYFIRESVGQTLTCWSCTCRRSTEHWYCVS